jgi:toxin secretion/phage lysis holin
MEKAIASVICTLSGVAFFLYGNDPTKIQWLITVLVLICFDLVMGIINAAMEKKFTRRLLLDGIRRKVGELLIIAICHLLDQTNMLQGALSLQTAATGFLIAYEAISVLDKIKIGGSPIPKILTDLLKKALDKYDQGSGSDHQSNE